MYYDPKIEYYIERGRELRAQAYAEALRRLWNGIRAVARRVSAHLAVRDRPALKSKRGVSATPVASGQSK